MLVFKPVKDNEKIKKYYPEAKLDKDAENCLYLAYESGRITGKCFVVFKDFKCFIEHMKTQTDDALLKEGLLRSALGFGGNRGAYMAYAQKSVDNTALLNLGFTENGAYFDGEIPELLKGSCCK